MFKSKLDVLVSSCRHELRYEDPARIQKAFTKLVNANGSALRPLLEKEYTLRKECRFNKSLREDLRKIEKEIDDLVSARS